MAEPHLSHETLHRLRVARIVDETHDAKSIVFDVPAELAAHFRYESGQFLTLVVTVDGVPLKRCYSLASAPVCDPEPKVTVKRVEGGRASNWLNDTLRAGDVVEVQIPAGRFLLRGDGPLVLFAGGSGITPIISIAKTALLTTSRPVRLVYANRDARSVIFKAELDELEKSHGARFVVDHRLDDVVGPIDPEDIRAVVERDATYYVCGPGPFMDRIERTLHEAGVGSEHVHVERFLSAPDPSTKHAPAEQGADIPTTIGIENEGARHDVPYTRGSTLLDAALTAGVDAPYSCKEGFCGCCAAIVLDGTVKVEADDALTPEAKKRGLILACQARPTSRTCAIRFVEY